VRANLVYRAFTRIGDEKVPDAKTLARIQSPAGYTFSVEGNDDLWIETGSEIATKP